MPYYHDDDVDSLVNVLPEDGTWMIIYCEYPRAAAEHVNDKLVALDFKNTAVQWDGALNWVGLGYPVSRSKVTLLDVDSILSD